MSLVHTPENVAICVRLDPYGRQVRRSRQGAEMLQQKKNDGAAFETHPPSPQRHHPSARDTQQGSIPDSWEPSGGGGVYS